jgi:signal transduction histidine kinase
MKSLVGDLLDFAQLSNGKFRKIEEKFNIRKTILEVIRIQEYKAMKKGVKIKTIFSNFDDGMLIDENPSSSLLEIDEDLGDQMYVICSDEQRIVQVVLNLLSNALKFTE